MTSENSIKSSLCFFLGISFMELAQLARFLAGYVDITLVGLFAITATIGGMALLGIGLYLDISEEHKKQRSSLMDSVFSFFGAVAFFTMGMYILLLLSGIDMYPLLIAALAIFWVICVVELVTKIIGRAEAEKRERNQTKTRVVRSQEDEYARLARYIRAKKRMRNQD